MSSAKRKHHHHQQQQQKQHHQHSHHPPAGSEPVAVVVSSSTVTSGPSPGAAAKRPIFPESAIEALRLIASRVSTSSNKQDLVRLAQEWIFLNEFDVERNTWSSSRPAAAADAASSSQPAPSSSRNAMQELQAVDCIRAYLASERDAGVREQVFNVLFGELAATASALQLLISYAVSLECTVSLDCATAWIIHNIGNEISRNVFNQLVYDHFVLGGHHNDVAATSTALIGLCERAPMFASLLMTIVLDVVSDDSFKYLERIECLNKLFDVFEKWVRVFFISSYSIKLLLEPTPDS